MAGEFVTNSDGKLLPIGCAGCTNHKDCIGPDNNGGCPGKDGFLTSGSMEFASGGGLLDLLNTPLGRRALNKVVNRLQQKLPEPPIFSGTPPTFK